MEEQKLTKAQKKQQKSLARSKVLRNEQKAAAQILIESSAKRFKVYKPQNKRFIMTLRPLAYQIAEDRINDDSFIYATLEEWIRLKEAILVDTARKYLVADDADLENDCFSDKDYLGFKILDAQLEIYWLKTYGVSYVNKGCPTESCMCHLYPYMDAGHILRVDEFIAKLRRDGDLE